MKEALRTCRVCKLEAHTEEDLPQFRSRKDLPHGRNNICHKCDQEQQDRNRTYETRKRSRVKIAYNITVDEYDKCMGTSPVCQICGKNEQLCYDHDHDNMEFRGVLCRHCNSALGLLGDNLEGLTKAFKYLGGVPSKH